MSEFEFGELRNFVYVAETSSFTEAARRAHLSTPAISKSIKRLEHKLEASLFERTSRRVELTLAGQTLLAHARTVLEAAEAFAHALDRPEGQLRGGLSIGTTPALAPQLCAAALGNLARAHPECLPEVRRLDLATLASELRTGRLDAAIHYGAELAVQGTHYEALARVQFELLAAADHPLARLDALASHQAVQELLARSAVVVPREFEPALRTCPKLSSLRVALRVDAVSLALEVAGAGDLVAFVPGFAAELAPHGRLRAVPLTLGAQLPLGISSRRRGLAARALRSCFCAALDQARAPARAA